MLLNIPAAPVMFFGGKGGVGKTTIANAIALKLSATASTLVVSTDPAHNVGHLWDTKVGDSPTTVRPHLDVMELDPARATDAHLKQAGDTMRRMMPEHLHKEYPSTSTWPSIPLARMRLLCSSALPCC